MNKHGPISLLCYCFLIGALLALVSCGEKPYEETAAQRRAIETTQDLYLQEKFQEAERLLLQLKMDQIPNADARYLLGLIRVALIDDEKAVRYFRETVTLDKEHLDGWLGLLQSELRLGDIEQAEQDWQAAEAIFPKSGRLHYEAGQIMSAQERFGEAIRMFEFAIADDSLFADAYYSLGNVLVKSGNRERGNEVLAKYEQVSEIEKKLDLAKQVVDLNPEEATAWYNLGRAYEQVNSDSNAIEAYRRAISLAPGFPEAYNNLGILFFRNGRNNEAGRAFGKALTLSDTTAKYHFNLGAVYARLGNVERARQHWQRALQLDPQYHRARQFLQELPAENQ